MTNSSLAFSSLAKNKDQLAHAYIVEGIDEQKRLLNVLKLASSLLCQTENMPLGESCGHCHSCNLLSADTHPDFMLVNAEKGTIGIDDIRSITELLSNMSHLSGEQVVIIECAENMTENASNALLKTLEEPTDRSFIFLLCSSKSTLLPTILSRCQFLQIQNKDKDQLKLLYPDLPDYIIGFSNNSESELARWVEMEKTAEFTDIYQLFIQWLKKQIPHFVLENKVTNDSLGSDFLLYLIEKRIRQLMLKSASQPDIPTQVSKNATQAHQLLLEFKQAERLIKGQNKPLAMSNFLTSIERLVS